MAEDSPSDASSRDGDFFPTGARRFVLAVDNSPYSRYAFQWTVRTLLQKDDELILVHVCEEGVDFRNVFHPSGPLSQDSPLCKKLAENYCGNTDLKGAKVKAILLKGDPGEAVCEFCNGFKPDQLIVGSRNRGTLAKLVLGSVGDYVMQHTMVPVTIVKTPPAFMAGIKPNSPDSKPFYPLDDER
eukprot:comp22588_c1_seq1/m.34605 comp22588_c1_seq1/g.34605  ORF comp22588_c1_seq1/g.34605 comp22588_c1_seq1/m.34605 type:complete len:185 (-) comp22588_c1_seq1:155-709(-)